MRRYLRHFPEAADLLNLDFAFHRIVPVAIRHIGGVGRIHWIDIGSYTAQAAEAFAADEERALEHLNREQHDALCRQLPHDAQSAVAFGLDCDGLDVRCQTNNFRLDFIQPLSHPKDFVSLSAHTFHTP
jgi:hypothetical protein